MNKKYAFLIVIFLIAASLAAFGRIAGNDFINFDDQGYVTENYQIQQGINLQTIKWALTTTYFSYWHPLTWLSHTLDWRLFGAHASGHHLVSLFLHIGAVIFLFLFLNKTTNNIWPSAFAAALFALHPLRVESVAWASERKDVLSMFFGMACLYSYAFWAEKEKLFQYFLCLILFALALMSKPMMVTLPFVLMLLDYWPLHRCQKAFDGQGKSVNSVGGLIGEKIPFICLTIACCIITFWAQNEGSSIASIEKLPFLERTANAIISYVAYLAKTFWPVNLALHYPYNFSISLWKVLISGIVLILITLAVLSYSKKQPFLFVGWFMYLGTLVPVIGIVQVGTQAMADRYSYLPSVGIDFILAWGIPLLFPNNDKRKKIFFPAGIVLLIILSVLTWRQCGYWKDSISLFKHTVHVTENNHLAHDNLGGSLLKEGKISEAFYHYNRAISIAPESHGYYLNRGNAYAGIGNNQLAVNDFNKAISLKPDYIDAYYNRGTLYGKIEQYQLAIEDFNKVISLKPDHINALNNKGIIYAKLAFYQKAIDDFNEVIRLKPDYAKAYNNRALVHFNMINPESGCSDARKACEMGVCATLEFAKGKEYCR
jgi:protein O-mannosyl-transferase